VPMFSCLDTPASVNDIMIACTRRALCFPLYRHWGLTLQIWKDVSQIINEGRRSILKRLLYLNEVFNHETYQVYNHIWIQDYSAWIQYANDNVIASLGHELNKVRLERSDTGFNLEDLEELANSAET
jgi:protein SHQ1